MAYYPNSTCLGLTEQLTQLRIMPYRYETGEMTAVSARRYAYTCGGTVPHGN